MKHWCKSRYSGDESGACVGVATRPSDVHIRDSKNPDGPMLTVYTASWAAFVTLSPGR
ncbi:DUF397 domain-containing protein [Streptomyces sp. HNM0663]|uniref:DUF397 domain-containing protein n=2 Tax=Streptomyces chengmaiensis TaxID=3040919 RepID=A0ABT6HHX0_9ACTN|nr:DUF397 domain-containing protein [Streptomyces chengmaiensis]